MLIAFLGVLGLLVGSFLNVVVARVPADRSVVSPPSACPRCDTPIAVRDNIPVVSWLLLRGRGRCCGEPIPVRYPLVEAGTAAAFALVAWWLGPVAVLPAFLFLAAISIALGLIDLDTFRLPYVIVAPSYPVAAVLLATASLAGRDLSSVVRMFVGGAVLWVFYRLLHAVYPAGMGYGDVRLSGLLGMYLGWLGWSELGVGAFLAFLVGGLAGIVVLAVGGGSLKTQIPYGPYMIVGAWLGAVWGGDVGGAYLRAVGLA